MYNYNYLPKSSDMLIKQQELYDKRLDDWTKDGKAAWDQLLALDIDDYVMINYPKNQKLNFSNIGPLRLWKWLIKTSLWWSNH